MEATDQASGVLVDVFPVPKATTDWVYGLSKVARII